MKKSINLMLLIGILSIAFFLSGCSSNLKLTINFNANNGNEITTLTYEQGKGFNMPDDPEKKEYVFGGWYTDDDTFKNEFTLSTIINYPLSRNMDLTVYAKWISNDEEEQVDDNEENDKTIASIEVKSNTLRNYYYMGDDELEVAGGKLIITYNNSSKKEVDITEDMISEFSTEYISGSLYYVAFGSVPDNSVTRRMKIEYEGMSVHYTYYLVSDVVSLEIVNQDEIEDFYYYNDFDLNSITLTLRATFRNGQINEFEASGSAFLYQKQESSEGELIDGQYWVPGQPIYSWLNNSNYVGTEYSKDLITNEKCITLSYRAFKCKTNIAWDYKTVKSADLMNQNNIYLNDSLEDICTLQYEVENEDGTINKSYMLQIKLTFEDDTTENVNAYWVYYNSGQKSTYNHLYNSEIETLSTGQKTLFYDYHGQIVLIEYEVFE